MKNASKVGRNDLCPCGSGRKFKRCCETKAQRKGPTQIALIVAVVGALIGAVIFGVSSFTSESAPAGPRQVWSSEHGHYHQVP